MLSMGIFGDKICSRNSPVLHFHSYLRRVPFEVDLPRVLRQDGVDVLFFVSFGLLRGGFVILRQHVEAPHPQQLVDFVRLYIGRVYAERI